jgi:ATP-binding cassette subfamily C protein
MSLILGKASGRSAYKAHVDLLQVQGLLLGTLANYRQLVTGRSAASFEEKFRVKRTSMTRESAIYGTITNLPRYITEIAVMVGVGLLIAQRSNGSGPGIPAPTIAIFLAGIFRIVASMLPIQSGLSQLRRIEPEGKIALDLIEKFKDAEPRDDHLTTSNTGLDILVRDLSFRYSGSKEYVFKDVNFTIEPGSYVAIVGKSGQGKSTLADLLMGLRAPDSGKILIGGKPPYRSGDLGYVPQTTSLIEGTLFENLTLLVGTSPSEAEIGKANNIIDSLELRPMVDAIPGGLMGQVGPGSFEMSGGQAQRVWLARALFFEPKVLILDEATSALDNQTESVIHEVLTRLRGSTTILVIAHRPQTIADAHQLLTVANGRILARTN